MASLEVYSTDAHIGAEDREIFQYTDVAQRVNHRKARADVERELLKRGFVDGLENIVDNRGWATATLLFTAEDDTGVTIPADFPVYSADDKTRVTFYVDEELILAAGESGEVTATAEPFGEPGNVPAETLIYFDALAGLASVTNEDIATGGEDHQLTQACVYRCLEVLYRDLMRNHQDSFWTKMMEYRRAYAEELSLIMAAGLEITDDSDDGSTTVTTRDHGLIRLERS